VCVGKKTMAIWLTVRLMLLEDNQKRLAQQRAADLVGVNLSSVRRWYADFVQSGYSFTASLRGHHPKMRWLLDEPALQQTAKLWVKKHARERGKPNLTVADFQHYLNSELLPSADDPPSQEGLFRVC
jgi:hypothetical protein